MNRTVPSDRSSDATEPHFELTIAAFDAVRVVVQGAPRWRARRTALEASRAFDPPVDQEVARRLRKRHKILPRGSTTAPSLFENGRLNDAKARLARGEAVYAVASALGYRHVPDFSAAFKDATGVPPSRWGWACKILSSLRDRFGDEQIDVKQTYEGWLVCGRPWAYGEGKTAVDALAAAARSRGGFNIG